ncbi:hypothetical protein ACLHZT_21390 [Aeromonas veronii]|uniref:hypothetical protein n=1 Tax=Aeromonas veronii TaxID=654 RepID=UPI003D0532A0
MKKLMSTLQRWGVFGLSVLGGHGATASPAHLSDEALSQLNLDNLPNMESSLNLNVNREFNFEVRHSPMPPDGTLRIP